ncbi:MAG TPA: class I SAM-dependent methyltransferase [Verrucomicrobiota bacterium]|nr:class I SAM-dependent methyltransferase [Verrucomicrobiota bacterium]
MSFFRRGGIKPFVKDIFRSRKDIAGKVVVDLPAGAGEMSRELRALGAAVEPYDLYPEFFKVDGLTCKFADLEKTLPIPTGHADYVLFQEGMEHLPDQLGPLREFNRILKKGGRLILTTPNPSCLRARLCSLLLDGYLFNNLPINETSAIRFLDKKEHRYYFGHIFLISAQRLRILGRVAGFRIAAIHPSKFSKFSVLLGVFYPGLLLVNLWAYFRSCQRREADPARTREILREVLWLNLHPRVLFAKKLFFEMEKESELADADAAFSIESVQS